MRKRVSELKEGDKVYGPQISYLQKRVAFFCLEDTRDYGDGSFAVRVALPNGEVTMRDWDEDENNPEVEVVDT